MEATSFLNIDNLHLPPELSPWAVHKIQRICELQEHYLQTDRIENISRFIADVVLLNLYDQQYQKNSPPITKKEIVVLTEVMYDGLGDYYNALTTAQTILKIFPDQEVLMAIDMDRERFEKVKQDSRITYYVPHKEENQEILNRIKQAALAIEVSTTIQPKYRIRQLHSILQELKNQGHHQRLLEYGIRYEMGLDYLSHGIFIKSLPELHLKDLNNNKLKRILFNKFKPESKHVKRYNDNTDLYFSYIHDQNTLLLFFYSIVASQVEGRKQVDIVSPFKMEKPLDQAFLKKMNIGEIQFCTFDPTKKGKSAIIKRAEKFAEGKRLRIINPFPLDQDDMFTLIQQSHPFAGCTGDQSISEMGEKIRFFEISWHMEAFFNSFVQTANIELPKEQIAFKQYLSACGEGQKQLNSASTKEIEQRALKIGESLRDPKILQEAQQLNQVIQEKFSVEEKIKGMISQSRFYQAFPELVSFDKELKEAFIKGEKKLNEIWTELSSRIHLLQDHPS